MGKKKKIEYLDVFTYFDLNYKMCQLKKPLVVETREESDGLYFTTFAPAIRVWGGSTTVTHAIQDLIWTAHHLFQEYFATTVPLTDDAKAALEKLSEYFREE